MTPRDCVSTNDLTYDIPLFNDPLESLDVYGRYLRGLLLCQTNILSKRRVQLPVHVALTSYLDLLHFLTVQVFDVCQCSITLQERPAAADKPARRLRNVCTVYVRAVGL